MLVVENLKKLIKVQSGSQYDPLNQFLLVFIAAKILS
jgi:hypothetical protein